MGQSFEMRLTETILIFFVLVPLTACELFGKSTLGGEAIDGKVIEEGSGKPIPNAIVVARWTGTISSWPADSHSTCFHVLTTTTGERGTYHFDPWKKKSQIGPVFDQRPFVSAHKAGYVWSSKSKNTIQYLEPFTGTRSERLKYLMRVSSGTSCGTQDESKKNLLPLKRQIYNEAKAKAKSKEDKETVEILLFGLEALEFGSVVALERMTERRKSVE